MSERFSRTERLIGAANMERLRRARVAVFGIGGVGGYTVEALARSGVGMLDLIDRDQICLSNINRQIIATTKSVGQYKVDAARERILDINPEAQVYTYKIFYLPDTASLFDFRNYDYIVDAIDTITGKLTLAEQALSAGVPIISSMGAGNKMDPSAFQIADISKTTVCPLARVMRRELKKRGIYHLKVVYSTEKPVSLYGEPDIDSELGDSSEEGRTKGKNQIPGSNAFVPSVAGLRMAGEVIRDLLAPHHTGRNG